MERHSLSSNARLGTACKRGSHAPPFGGPNRASDSSSCRHQAELPHCGFNRGDATHKKSRGLAIVQKEAEPGENGQPRYKLTFQGGQRRTTVQRSGLDLALVHLDHLRQPKALEQRVAVNVGAHQGTQGVTKAKVRPAHNSRSLTSSYRSSSDNFSLLRHSVVDTQLTWPACRAPLLQLGDHWTVKLDGHERCESFATWRLHALEEPDPPASSAEVSASAA